MISVDGKFVTYPNGNQVVNQDVADMMTFFIENKVHTNPNYQWNDRGFANLFAQTHQHKCVYVTGANKWYLYENGKWSPADNKGKQVEPLFMEFAHYLNDYALALTPDVDIPEERKKQYLKFTDKMISAGKNKKVFDTYASNVLQIDITEFDQNPYYINLQDCTYDLETKQVIEHNPNNLFAVSTNCSLNGNKPFPRWQKFIDEIMDGNKEKADFLQRALGYSIFGRQTEQCMFIAFGRTTRNGKSTLLNSIQNALGDYATNVDVSLICSDDSDDASKPTPALARLRGKRLAIMNESSKMDNFNVATIKRYTGGDPVNARFLYGDIFTYTPQFKMWLSCNTLPDINDRTIFLSERLHVIDFTRHFTQADQDKNLGELFKTPDAKTAIIRWLINGYYLWEKHGLNPPPSVRLVTDLYAKETDKIQGFIDDCCKIVDDDNVRTPRTDLYEKYKQWCRKNEYKADSSRDFYKELSTRIDIQPTVYYGTRSYKFIKLR